jgi:hypothetical protein
MDAKKKQKSWIFGFHAVCRFGVTAWGCNKETGWIARFGPGHVGKVQAEAYRFQPKQEALYKFCGGDAHRYFS